MAKRVLPRKCTGHSKHPLPTTEKKTLVGGIAVNAGSHQGRNVSTSHSPDSVAGILTRYLQAELQSKLPTSRPFEMDFLNGTAL